METARALATQVTVVGGLGRSSGTSALSYRPKLHRLESELNKLDVSCIYLNKLPILTPGFCPGSRLNESDRLRQRASNFDGTITIRARGERRPDGALPVDTGRVGICF